MACKCRVYIADLQEPRLTRAEAIRETMCVVLDMADREREVRLARENRRRRPRHEA